MYEHELYHYGVKGMKWGVRKDRKTSGSKRKRSKKEDISKLSDEELKKRTGRMELENRYMNAETNYKKLSNKRLHKGRTILLSILATAGTQIATQYVSKKLGVGVTNLETSLSKSVDQFNNAQQLRKLGLI
ncbi:MAG: hypothetical protein K2O64_03110 [Lactobacillus sp.]|nr:hypothetical protein [Lactobacillus sp.]